MRISIGADHRGYELKDRLIKNFSSVEWDDVGMYSSDRVDYPVVSKKICENILSGASDQGILICWSGVGMSMAANRNKGIYAALCWCEDIARLAKEDDGANLLVLPAGFLDLQGAAAIFNVWMEAKFKWGIYFDRLQLIDQ
jgi:ribose 5-phosphate isomerase B